MDEQKSTKSNGGVIVTLVPIKRNRYNRYHFFNNWNDKNNNP